MLPGGTFIIKSCNFGLLSATLLATCSSSLHIYSIDAIKRNQYVYVDGEVKYPGEYPYYENMSIVDMILV